MEKKENLVFTATILPQEWSCPLKEGKKMSLKRHIKHHATTWHGPQLTEQPEIKLKYINLIP